MNTEAHTLQSAALARFKAVIEILKNLKELVIILGAILAGAAWLISYFATREQLEKLECYTKVNVRMLQATSGGNYASQQIRQTLADIREQKRIVVGLRASKGELADVDPNVVSAENRLDELLQIEKTHETNKDAETKTSQRAFAALTQNACLDTLKRADIVDKLARGEF